MAQLRQVTIVCDPCEADGKDQVATETLTINVGREKPRTIDICGEHLERWRDLREIARARGR